MNLGVLYIEDKIFLTVAFIIASVLALFLNPKVYRLSKSKDTIFTIPNFYGFLLKEDGTMRKYTKSGIVIFFLSWIPFIWIFG
jgi:hypothetical protein